jgi:hypothetical protein
VRRKCLPTRCSRCGMSSPLISKTFGRRKTNWCYRNREDWCKIRFACPFMCVESVLFNESHSFFGDCCTMYVLTFYRPTTEWLYMSKWHVYCTTRSPCAWTQWTYCFTFAFKHITLTSQLKSSVSLMCRVKHLDWGHM